MYICIKIQSMIIPASTTNKPLIYRPVRGTFIKSLRTALNAGFLTYGEDDSYPYAIYNLIMASKTALSAAGKMADFTIGDGFENKSIDEIEICRNSFGQKITVLDFAKEAARNLSFFNGFYAKCSRSDTDKIKSIYIPKFENVRLGISDDLENISTVVVKMNRGGKFFYDPCYTFTSDEKVVIDRISKNGKHIPEVYVAYLNSENIYPISPIEAVALDCSNEALSSLMKNNAYQNGLSKKTIFMYKGQPQSVDEFGNAIPSPIETAVRGMLGADGDSMVAIECQQDSEGRMIEDIKAVSIESNIQKDLTEGWDADASNAIRMQFDGLPQNILDAGLKTGITSESGVMLKVAYEIYNQATKYRRDFLAKCIGEILSQHENEVLRNNKNWNILPKTLNINNL